MMRRDRSVWILSGWLGLVATAQAELQIEISRGVEQAVPVAVVPFGWAGGANPPPLDVAAVVASDLARSGRFAPIDRGDMLQRPTQGAEVDFDDWRILDTEALVIGQLSPQGAGYEIQFQLFDVIRGQQILGYRLPSSADNLRAASHRVADLIYEKLTGIKGVFSTRIAYVTVIRAQAGTRYQLVVADADGANARTVVESAESIMSPAWSPDGRKLAYVSFENRRSEIWVQTLRSGARQRVSARPGVNGAPAWSPDGRRLALALSKPQDGNLDIYTLDIAGQVLTRVTTWPSIETEPAWSADGGELFFTSDYSGAPQIYRVGSDGGRPQRVTFEGSYNARARLAPDGESIAVVHNDRGNYRIATVDLARALTQVLTDGRLDESPSFAPNGETLIYATREGNRGVLATVTADGRIRQRISAVEGDVREPAWSPFGLN